MHPGPDVPGETPGPPSVGSPIPGVAGTQELVSSVSGWLPPRPWWLIGSECVALLPRTGGSLPARPRSCEGPVACPPAHPPVPDRDGVRRGRRCSAWSMRSAHLRCDPRGPGGPVVVSPIVANGVRCSRCVRRTYAVTPEADGSAREGPFADCVPVGSSHRCSPPWERVRGDRSPGASAPPALLGSVDRWPLAIIDTEIPGGSRPAVTAV